MGTAAAFRAKELGLSALVIDDDDLMKRIRDYAKDKQILPDYGGGDRMQFPKAGPLIAQLHFQPIDKDRMCVEWKRLYRENSIPAQVGVELTGLQRQGDIWQAQTWNHNLKAEQMIRARHVVLAFGRGVPRRLDVPGDTNGLAFGMSDASKYVGDSVCVIGGGTSAGEAVIAISNAKAGANDASPVYWSYRGDKMPKVSKALAEVFFDAFMGNGNIRYLPSSEPVEMVENADQVYLSLRIARVAAAGRPTETTQLEFARAFCIACIGEDIPEALLNRVGVPLIAGGAANKPRPAVTPLLETRQPNVYLAGDVLSPMYLETEDLSGDPSQFREIKRRGNIKAAMRDGVLVAEVIAQKLAGRVKIEVNLDFEEQPEAAPTPEVVAPPPGPVSPAATPKSVIAHVSEILQKPPAVRANSALVAILPSGVEANEYPLRPDGTTTIGRNADIAFSQDATLNDVHATIDASAGEYTLRDQGADSGVLIQLSTERPRDLARGAVLRAGRQWLVVGDRRRSTRLMHYTEMGERKASFDLKEGTTIIGRQSPDVTIAPEDMSLSRRHLSLTNRGGTISAKDLGSSNGTQLRVSAPTRLFDGDRILLGQQLLEFRDDRKAAAPPVSVSLDTSVGRIPGQSVTLPAQRKQLAAPPPPQPPKAAPADIPPPKAALAAVPPPPKAAPAGDGQAPGVFFDGLGKLAPCAKGQTICEAAEKAGIKLEADCHQGVCGLDPVKVLEGAQNLNAIGGTERSTLEDLCSLEPGPYRLACVARVNGPVKVSIVKT